MSVDGNRAPRPPEVPRIAAKATRAHRGQSRRLPGVLALAISLAVSLAPLLAVGAATSPSVYLEELTSPELHDRIRAGATTAIIPIGGTEQNGPHIVLGKHNVRVRVLAGRIAADLGRAIVAPVVAYVPEGDPASPTGHMRYPGTLSIPTRTFEQVLEAAAESLRHHGFRDVVFLGDHGGYQGSIRTVAVRLNHAWRTAGARAHAVPEYYRATETAFAAALRERGFSDREIGKHAGVADTSLALAVAPGLVRSDRLASVVPDREGVSGDPRRASAALGQAGVDAIVNATVAAIRAAITRR